MCTHQLTHQLTHICIAHIYKVIYASRTYTCITNVLTNLLTYVSHIYMCTHKLTHICTAHIYIYMCTHQLTRTRARSPTHLLGMSVFSGARLIMKDSNVLCNGVLCACACMCVRVRVCWGVFSGACLTMKMKDSNVFCNDLCVCVCVCMCACMRAFVHTRGDTQI